MTNEEALKKGAVHGNSIGQVALSEFILKAYGNELSPKLTSFLERLLETEYNKIAAEVGKPAEDVALEVAEVLNAKTD